MDASNATRRPDSNLTAVPPALEPQRALKVRAEYRLTEAGRKASLLHGGNGQARQQVTLTLPATRLHLVQVAKDGTAALKLRPQFKLNAEQRPHPDRRAAFLRSRAHRRRATAGRRPQPRA